MLAYIDNVRPVTVDLTAGTSTGAGNDHFTNVGGVIGSPYDDTITGTDGPNLLTGNGGSDRISRARRRRPDRRRLLLRALQVRDRAVVHRRDRAAGRRCR